MHRLTLVAFTMLGALVTAGSEAQAQFGYYSPACGFGGYYRPAPVAYGYGPFGYSSYAFSGISIGGLNIGMGTVGPYPAAYGAPYGYPYAVPMYPSYPVGYTYVAPPPVVVPPQPVVIDQGPFDNPVINEWMPRQQGEGNIQNSPVPRAAPEVANQFPNQFQQRQAVEPRVMLRPSTLEARRRSIRAMSLADEAIRAQNWPQAYIKYKEAATATPDQAEPQFRMALTLAMMNRFGLAVDAFKRSLQINPGWPASATLLDDFLGERNLLAKQVMLEQVTRWAREDIRDADRLFVVGVLLYLDQDLSRATPFFKTADQLAGSPAYTQAFLNVQPVAGQQNGRQVVPAEQRQAAPAQPVMPAPAAEPAGPQLPVPPDAAPGVDGPALVAPQQLPEAPPPAAVTPRKTAPVEPKAPAVLPRRVPEENSDGLGPVIPVLPAPQRAAVGEPVEKPLDGPKLVSPDEELPVSQPVASRVKFERAALPRNTAVIFRGRQRYEFFPRPRPVAEQPTVVQDVFSR